jgi:hypothetical protein
MCFELMREMHWTWADYEATPIFVRQFCWDFIMRRRRIHNSEYEKQAAAQNAPGIRRVKR